MPRDRSRRLMLSVPPELDGTLDRLAAATDKPRATLVTDLLLEMRPQLDDLARVIGNVRSGRVAAAKQALRHMMGNAFAEMMTAQQPDMFPSKGRRK